MLIRSTWTIKVTEPTVLPRTYGLELVKLLHQRLHLPLGDGTLPNTGCAGMLGRCTVTPEFFTFHPEESYQLVLCGLQEDASKAIAAFQIDAPLEFLGASFAVRDRQDYFSSYEQLYTTHVAQEPEPTRQLRLRFVTPTAFAQHNLQLPLPVPTLLFRSWLDRWNHFASVYLGGDELIGYLAGVIALKRHHIRTRAFRVHRGTVSGFVGEVQLQTRYRTDPLLANVAHLLVQYAPFAGTGIKTRLGMGQTRLDPEPPELGVTSER